MTRLGAKIAVDTLDDERYARIENRVVAAFRQQTVNRALGRSWRRRWRVLAPVVALACACLLVYAGARWFGSDERPAHAPEQWAGIVTDDAGQTRYRIGEAELAFGPGTELEVRRAPTGAIHVDLAAGAVDCEVEPIPGRARFTVHAGDVDVTVVGTAFRVHRDARDVRVSVTRGQVRVDTAEGTRFLGAGESWSGLAVIAAAGEEASGFGERARRGGSPDDTGAGASVVGIAENGAGSGLGGREGGDVLPEMPSSDRPHDAETPEPGGDASRPRGTRPRSERRVDGSGQARPRKRTPEQRELAQDKPERGRPPAGSAALAALMDTEAEDARAAVASYREFALGRGAEAEFALYSQAYLQHLALGDSSAALATLNHYERRFAKGTHRESALWLRIHILCDQAGDIEKCRAAAHTYISRFPNGRHRRLAGKIIHWEL